MSTTRPSRTTHVAEERLHGREVALDVDEDRAIGPVRDTADHAVTTRRLSDARAVVHTLDATARETMPVDEFAHGGGLSGSDGLLATVTSRSPSRLDLRERIARTAIKAAATATAPPMTK